MRQPEGISSPQPLNGIERLSQWIYDTVHPYIEGRVLEIGARSGTISGYFVNDNTRIRISDPRSKYYQLLQEKFKDNSCIKGIHKIDPKVTGFETVYSSFLGKFHTVLLLNTIEVDADDPELLLNIKNLVIEGGYLIMNMPVRIAFFNNSEEVLDYWKHNARKILRKLLGVEFELIEAQFFNVSEIPADDIEDTPSFQISRDNIYTQFGLSVIMFAKRKPPLSEVKHTLHGSE